MVAIKLVNMHSWEIVKRNGCFHYSCVSVLLNQLFVCVYVFIYINTHIYIYIYEHKPATCLWLDLCK